MKVSRYLSIASLVGLAACGQAAGSQIPEVVRVLPHDFGASTQGLLLHDGTFYESTGQYGESTLRAVDVETGEVLRILEISQEYFGEGLALVGNELIQLTWQENVAFAYDLESFDLVREIEYEGEGWGLCYDGESLFMSNGSAILHRRDPNSFEILESLEVTLNGSPVRNLNELECVGSTVWANIWLTGRIVAVNAIDGRVTAVVDASDLPVDRSSLGPDDVLNGIAHDPDTDHFLLTGKRWPSLFEVELVEAAGDG